MAIPLVGDITKAMSKSFGVLIEDAADGDCGVTLRGTFIIDPKGESTQTPQRAIMHGALCWIPSSPPLQVSFVAPW